MHERKHSHCQWQLTLIHLYLRNKGILCTSGIPLILYTLSPALMGFKENLALHLEKWSLSGRKAPEFSSLAWQSGLRSDSRTAPSSSPHSTRCHPPVSRVHGNGKRTTGLGRKGSRRWIAEDNTSNHLSSKQWGSWLPTIHEFRVRAPMNIQTFVSSAAGGRSKYGIRPRCQSSKTILAAVRRSGSPRGSIFP